MHSHTACAHFVSTSAIGHPLRATLPGISILPVPDGTVIHSTAAARTKFCSSHNRPVPETITQPALTCDRLEPLFSGHFSDTGPHVRRVFAGVPRSAVARYPPGTGSAQILRSMSPNSRRVRCPSASRSQQEPVVPGMLHQSASGFHQPLLETRERPALDPRRQDQSAALVHNPSAATRQLSALWPR